MRRIVSFSVLFTLACLIATPCLARPSPQDELRQLEKSLANEKKDNAAYRAAQAKAQNLLNSLQDKLVEQTKELQTTEQDLLVIQEKNKVTADAFANMERELVKQHKNLAELLMAAQRLQRVPPEALLLRPARPIDAARANLLLQRSTPDIAKQVTAIRAHMEHLDRLKTDLIAQEKKLAKLKRRQQSQQQALSGAIKERQVLLKATTQKAQNSQDSIARMNRQAADLRSMLADLARQPAAVVPSRPTAQTQAKNEKGRWGQSVMSFFRRGKGPSQLPIVGTIRTSYGEKLASGANSQGLSIGGTPGGIVVAPEKGTIRFAGPFRQYRLLVILEHAGGYHSLLGGLSEVYAKVGNTVAAGEPIGKLNSDAAHANLYYEVRQNGKPVDPRHSLRG
jgi:septal ring factor EnvC (AmiA/AmiB activator)